MTKLLRDFYRQDALVVAQSLIGKLLCRKFDDGRIEKFRIIETEAYKAPEDKACHASKGRTKRTEILFGDGGFSYVHLTYGIHWMMNIITGVVDQPQGVLIRGIETAYGPGRVGRRLELAAKNNKTDMANSDELWVEDDGVKLDYIKTPRIGIDYAGEPWISMPWRFYSRTEESKKFEPRIKRKAASADSTPKKKDLVKSNS